MAIRKRNPRKKREIDLTGPAGNAYCLLGTADNLAYQLGYSERDRELLQEEMMSSDYENLIETFDKHFGRYIDLVR